MAITPLSSVTLTSGEEQAVLASIRLSWPYIFELITPGSSTYLSFSGSFNADFEDLNNWAWVGDPNDRPDDTTLQSTLAAYMTQTENEALETARVAKWKSIVTNEVNNAIQNIPGWFSWTEEQALAWMTAQVEPELTGSAPKTLQLLESLIRLVIAMRNQQWPNFEGS